jgi:soluble lytic murein transglycosylase-like protein
MKLIILASALLFSPLAAFWCAGPDAPKPISIQAPTEQTIKEGVKHEQRVKAYRHAGRIAAQVYRHNGCKATYSDITGQVAVDYGLSPRLLAALVFVESSCNPNAVSGRDSVGLTQINPKYHHYKRAELKNPQRSLEIGASILSAYVHRYGLVKGLHAYNGFGNPTNSYANKVLAAAGLQG